MPTSSQRAWSEFAREESEAAAQRVRHQLTLDAVAPHRVFGRIDILVANHGINKVVPHTDLEGIDTPFLERVGSTLLVVRGANAS